LDFPLMQLRAEAIADTIIALSGADVALAN
jgi:hypothetical protein